MISIHSNRSSSRVRLRGSALTNEQQRMHSATSDPTFLPFPVAPSSHPAVSELSFPPMADLGFQFQRHQITVSVQNLDLLTAVERRSPAMRGLRQHRRRAGSRGPRMAAAWCR